MRKFWVLLRKEVRELLTPQILLPFVLTVLLFAAIGNIIGNEGQNGSSSQQVAVVDLDKTQTSAAFVSAVEKSGFAVIDPGVTDAAALPAALRSAGVTLGMIVPKGFEAGILGGTEQKIGTYAIVDSFSLSSTTNVSVLKTVLAAANDALSAQLIAKAAPGSDPAVLKNPVQLDETVVVGSKQAQTSVDQVYGFISSQTTFIPIVLFIVIIFAAQMIATTIASEKENKTLETLLASPVSRSALITAKMFAAGLVALLSAGAYMVGLRYYMNGITQGLGGSAGLGTSGGGDTMAALGLTLTPADWALLGLSMFMAILVALAIATILGAFAENVKAVQSLLAPLTILIMIPYFLTLFIDINKASPLLKYVVLAIPFTHAFTTAPNLFLNDYRTVFFGIAYQLVWFVGLVIIAARIFSSDRLLTMKLGLRRKRRS